MSGNAGMPQERGHQPTDGGGIPAAGQVTVDPERVAALLDGRLDAAQRAEVLAQLEASPEALEAYADAVAVLRELEAEPDATRVAPAESRRTRFAGRRSMVYSLALAAGIVLVVLVVRENGARPESLPEPSAMVAAIARPPAEPGEALGAALWSEQRSGDVTLSMRARATRLGVRIVQLAWMARAGDTAATAAALQIAAFLDDVPAGSVAAAAYRAMADRAPAAMDDAELARAARLAEEVTDGRALRAGAWLEVARVAVQQRDTEFLHATGSREVARAIVSDASEQPAAALAARLDRELRAPAPDWEALRDILPSLLRALASR